MKQEDPIGQESLDQGGPPEAPATLRRSSWLVPVVLMVATFLSTLFVGAHMAGTAIGSPADLAAGLPFAGPLMAILLAHELGHFIAGRVHRVDVSPPYFIPMPVMLLGTMGAVIRIRGPIRTRSALLDIGAAGPLAGLAIALPVLVFGIAMSPVEPLPAPGTGFIMEGRSLLYLGILYAVHGVIPATHDIMLTPTAFAGWAGLLITMINLLPVGQLDGGHVAYALLGRRQDAWSERIRRALPLLAVVVTLWYGVPAYVRGLRGERLGYELMAGVQWLTWAGVLWLMSRTAGRKHPPTLPAPLSPNRRIVGIATLVAFALLFMPSWMRQQ